MNEETKELATVLGNVRALSDKTNEEQTTGGQKSVGIMSPEEAANRMAVLEELLEALNGRLSPLGLHFMGATVLFDRTIGSSQIHDNLIRARIVPEVKVGTTEDSNGIPSWLLGNLCD